MTEAALLADRPSIGRAQAGACRSRIARQRPQAALVLGALLLAGCEEATAISGGSDAASIDAAIDAASDRDGGSVIDLLVDDAGPAGCGDVTTFATGVSPQRELHVATSGSDNNGDGSPGRPFATLGRAARQAMPGTAIRIHAGTYNGGTFLGPLAGTANAPIWIGGVAGESRPVIQGGTEGLHLSKVRYLIVEHLEVRGATGNGINCDDGGDYANAEAARFLLFRDLDIHDIGAGGNEDCLKLSGLRDFFVLDSRFSRCGGAGSGSGVDDVGCHHGLIARNQFQQLSANAVQAKGGTSDIEIRANLLVDAGVRGVNAGGSTGFAFFRPPLSMGEPNAEARDVRVLANVIHGSEAAVAFVGCVDCVVAGNTILDPGKWVMRILQETTTSGGYTFLPASRGRFENNVVWFTRAAVSTFVNVGPDTDAASFTFARNLWYAHDAPARSAPQLPTVEDSAVIGLDPRLADPAQNDVHIPADSPAAGRGAPLANLSGDYYGRCYSRPPAIGAAEASP